MTARSFGAPLSALVIYAFFTIVPAPLHAQQGSVALSVCNAGKVAVDVFVAKGSPVASSHIVPATCSRVYSENAGLPAYVGFGLVDSHGQWGTARRLDLLPDFGIGVLTKADKNVSIRQGGKDVSTPMQLLFKPRNPICREGARSASASLPLNATAGDRANAAMLDANSSRLGLDRPSCETLNYALNVVAYPNSREITFNNFCEPCNKKAEASITPEERAAQQQRSDAVKQEIGNLSATGPLAALIMGNLEKQAKQQAQEEEKDREEERRRQQPESYTRMNWNEMKLALANVHGSEGRPPEMPQFLIIRGTVSRVDLSPPGASQHWVNVYFRESSEQASTVYETSYGAFNICASNAGIFVDMFGPDFRSRMIGQVLEVQGEYQRNYCKGWKGSIRVTLARQVHSAGSKSGKDHLPAGTGISYGDFLKALAKAEKENPKPPVVSMETVAARAQEENRKMWAAPHQSPASYDPQWMDQNIVVTGTVSRVDVDPRRFPQWVTIYFKESPDSSFVVCSPSPNMFRARVGPDLSVLVGKTLEAAGEVETPYCGHEVPKGSIRVVESEQWQLH
jgi:hypothetical protein